MTANEIADAAAQFAPKQKLRLLTRLSFELTIAARSTYVPGSDEIAAPHQLRPFNEMQHRVTGCLLGLLDDRTDDAWLWQYIAESSEHAECAHEAIQACSRALASIGSNDQGS